MPVSLLVVIGGVSVSECRYPSTRPQNGVKVIEANCIQSKGKDNHANSCTSKTHVHSCFVLLLTQFVIIWPFMFNSMLRCLFNMFLISLETKVLLSIFWLKLTESTLKVSFRLTIAFDSYLTALHQPNGLDKLGLVFAASDERQGLSDGCRQIICSTKNMFDNLFCSTLVSDNYGMVIYVTVINFFLPAFILAPLFIRWSDLTNQFALKRDISCEILNDEDGLDMQDDREENMSGAKSNVGDSLDSLEVYRKTSRVTELFLSFDRDFPRTLFAMAILHAVTW